MYVNAYEKRRIEFIYQQTINLYNKLFSIILIRYWVQVFLDFSQHRTATFWYREKIAKANYNGAQEKGNGPTHVKKRARALCARDSVSNVSTRPRKINDIVIIN